MNLAQKYAQLGRRQNVIQEGINDLKRILAELADDRAAMDRWGTTAVMANVVLVPLNCIVNAFELGSVNTAYQHVAKMLYEKYAKSGTRAEGGVAKTVSVLKKGVLEALKAKGLKQAVPGANILFGLVEDSLAAFQTIQMVDKGQTEALDLSRQIRANIGRMVSELEAIGILRAQLLDQVQQIRRTA